MMKNRQFLLLLVSGLAVAIAPACGDPEDPATNNSNNTKNNNPNNDPNNKPDECGAGKVKAAFNGGAEKCYTSCPGGSECTAPQVCKDADGATAKICVDGVAPMTCQAGEVKASYQGGPEQCYKTCTDDTSCGDAMKVCKPATGGGAQICVMGEEPMTGPCKPDETFKGQIGGTKTGDGGTYATTNTSYADDAGIEAVIAAFKTRAATLPENDQATADINEAILPLAEADQLAITGGTITATWPTAASQFAFYVQDKKSAMLVFVPAAKNAAGMTVSYKALDGNTQPIPTVTLLDGSAPMLKVGQKVNFKVTGLVSFSGTPQVALVEDLEVVSDNNEIYVQEMSGKDLDVASMWGQIVRLGGKVTSSNGGCGGNNKCYTVTHGENEDKTVEFRTNSTFVSEATVGKCMTWVGPLGSFPGFLSDAPKAQLNTDNYSWARTPFVEMN